MKHLLCILVFISFSYSSATIPMLFAQGSTGEREAEGEARQEMQSDEGLAAIETGGSFSGEVVGVNPYSRIISVRDSEYGGDTYLFLVNKSTGFVTAESLSDIEAGDRITIDYYTIGDKQIAENIVLEDKAYREEGPAPAVEKVLSD